MELPADLELTLNSSVCSGLRSPVCCSSFKYRGHGVCNLGSRLQIQRQLTFRV